MRIRMLLFRLITLAILLVLTLPVTAASAHGSTQVGNYTLEIGFKTEPAYQDVPNALELIITNTSSHAGIAGLENSLQAEIVFGASRKTLKIEPAEGGDGNYTAAVIPTEVGDYTWHIFGKIENTPVDISMTSSPTTFASVVPQSSDAFPNRGSQSPAVLQNEIQRARNTATIALIIGAIGVLLGLAALGSWLTRSKN